MLIKTHLMLKNKDFKGNRFIGEFLTKNASLLLKSALKREY